MKVPMKYLFAGYFGIKVSSCSAKVVGLLQLVIFTVLVIAIDAKANYNGLAYFNVLNSLDAQYGSFLVRV